MFKCEARFQVFGMALSRFCRQCVLRWLYDMPSFAP